MPFTKQIILATLILFGCFIMVGAPLSIRNWIHENERSDFSERFQSPIDEVEMNYQAQASIPSPSFYINIGSKFLGGLGLVVIALGITGYRRQLTEIGSVLLGQFLLFTIFTLMLT